MTRAALVVVAILMLPGACGIATALAQTGTTTAPEPTSLGAVLTWAATVLGMATPPAGMIAGILYTVRRSCASLDDVDLRWRWEGRTFRFTVDAPGGPAPTA